MTEINLLRWHQTNHPMQHKKQFFIIIFLIFLFFIASHFILNNKLVKSNREVLELRNQLEMVQRSPWDESSSDQLQFSQNQLWKMLGLLSCISHNNIQVTKIISEKKQINMTGLVDSAVTLKKSLEYCLDKNSSINKMIFSEKNKIDFLQYSIVLDLL